MTLPACSRGLNDRFITVLPHNNIILQAKDMAPQLVTYNKGPRGSCASIEIFLDLKARILNNFNVFHMVSDFLVLSQMIKSQLTPSLLNIS